MLEHNGKLKMDIIKLPKYQEKNPDNLNNNEEPEESPPSECDRIDIIIFIFIFYVVVVFKNLLVMVRN